MRLTARRMATRLATSQKWQAVPLGLVALRALRDGRGVAFPARKPDKVYGKIGNLEVRLRKPSPRDKARAAPALPSVLRGDVGGAELQSGAASPRRGSL